MNIAIYDTDHFETTYTLFQLLNIPGNKITLFVTENVAAALKEMPGMEQVSPQQWVILPQASYRNAVTVYRVCRHRNIAALYFSTIAHHHLFFAILCRLLPKTKTLLTIHDAHGFFKPRLRLEPRSIFRFIGIKALAGSVDVYSTLLGATKAYIQQVYKSRKNIVTIPGSFFDETSIRDNPPAQQTIIAIPGSVDKQRRDYTSLFTALSFWSQQEMELEVILLGGTGNKTSAEVVRQCKLFSSQKLQVTVYDSPFVSQQEYDRQLQRCDFMYAPLQPDFQGGSLLPETYGLTKSSGCFYDAIRFAKPLLLPAAIPVPDEMAAQTIVHDSAQALANFIANLTPTEKKAYKALAVQNARRFSLAAIRQRLAAEGLKGYV